MLDVIQVNLSLLLSTSNYHKQNGGNPSTSPTVSWMVFLLPFCLLLNEVWQLTYEFTNINPTTPDLKNLLSKYKDDGKFFCKFNK